MAMHKAQATSPRFRLWTAGFLILAGTLILFSTAWQQTYWWMVHPVPSGWYTISNRTYSGVLSQANQSVVIPLESLPPRGSVRLQDFSTNDTPVTLALRDWNNSLVLQLVNSAGDDVYDPLSLELFGGLAHPDHLGGPTLTIARTTGDATFFVRVVIKGFVAVDPPPAPWYEFIVGYGLGVALICIGFGIVEDVLRDLRQGRV